MNNLAKPLTALLAISVADMPVVSVRAPLLTTAE